MGYYLIFLLAFSAPKLVFANSVDLCKPTDIRHKSVRGRALKVVFPAGYQVTVVGHNHGDRQIYDLIDSYKKNQLQKLTLSKLRERLKQIVQQNLKPQKHRASDLQIRNVLSSMGINVANFVDEDTGGLNGKDTVMSHAIADYQFLSEKIKRKEVDFVGYEGAPEIVVDNLNWNIAIYRYLLNKITPLNDPEFTTLLRQAIMSGSNGSVFKYIEAPILYNLVPIIGTEPSLKETVGLDEMHTAFDNLIEKANEYMSSLGKKQQETYNKEKLEPFANLLIFIFNQVSTMSIYKASTLEKAIDQLKTFKFPEYKKEMKAIFKAFRMRIEENNTRDKGSALSLIKQKGNGIHFVGYNHLYNTVRHLAELCEVAGQSNIPDRQ